MLNLQTLPFPVAYPLSFAQDPSLGPRDRLHNAQFATYQAMRVTTLLLLADYLHIEDVEHELDPAIRALRKPTWGDWVSLGRRLCLFWSRNRTRPAFFPRLRDAWMAVGVKNADSRWRNLLKGLPGLTGTPARNAIDAIQRIRNDRAHRTATLTADLESDEMLLRQIMPVVEEMCAELFHGEEVCLFQRVSAPDDPLRVVHLHGPHRDFVFEATTPPYPVGEFGTSAVVALVNGACLPLYSLFAARQDWGSVEEVALIDELRKARVTMLGVQTHWHEQSENVLEPLFEALRKKGVDLWLDDRKRVLPDGDTLVSWARRAAGTEGVEYDCLDAPTPWARAERGGIPIEEGMALFARDSPEVDDAQLEPLTYLVRTVRLEDVKDFSRLLDVWNTEVRTELLCDPLYKLASERADERLAALIERVGQEALSHRGRWEPFEVSLGPMAAMLEEEKLLRASIALREARLAIHRALAHADAPDFWQVEARAGLLNEAAMRATSPAAEASLFAEMGKLLRGFVNAGRARLPERYGLSVALKGEGSARRRMGEKSGAERLAREDLAWSRELLAQHEDNQLRMNLAVAHAYLAASLDPGEERAAHSKEARQMATSQRGEPSPSSGPTVPDLLRMIESLEA